LLSTSTSPKSEKRTLSRKTAERRAIVSELTPKALSSAPKALAQAEKKEEAKQRKAEAEKKRKEEEARIKEIPQKKEDDEAKRESAAIEEGPRNEERTRRSDLKAANQSQGRSEKEKAKASEKQKSKASEKQKTRRTKEVERQPSSAASNSRAVEKPKRSTASSSAVSSIAASSSAAPSSASGTVRSGIKKSMGWELLRGAVTGSAGFKATTFGSTRGPSLPLPDGTLDAQRACTEGMHHEHINHILQRIHSPRAHIPHLTCTTFSYTRRVHPSLLHQLLSHHRGGSVQCGVSGAAAARVPFMVRPTDDRPDQGGDAQWGQGRRRLHIVSVEGHDE
jgi:hypothetical protein